MSEWFPNLTGQIPHDADIAIQNLFKRLYAAESEIAKLKSHSRPSPTPALAISPASLSQIQKSLQTQGTNPLNVAGLFGVLSQPQKGAATHVTSLPDLKNILSQPGTLIEFKGQIYYFDSSTNPGQWLPLKASAILHYLNATMGGSYTLTNAYALVTGLSLTANLTGKWLVHGDLGFTYDSADASLLTAALFVAGSPAGTAVMGVQTGATNSTIPGSKTWVVTANNGDAIEIRARKSAGAGTSSVSNGTITAIWLSP
jgi:hypothetical protein